MRTAYFLLALAGIPASSALAQAPQVVFCEHPSSAKSIVPDTRDLGGALATSRWKAIEDLAVRQDGGAWVVKGRNDLGSDLEAPLILGSGLSGDMFAQEGQPVAGGASGELYDFFDSGDPVSWNASGNIGYSVRTRGDFAQEEKLVLYAAAFHTVVIQQGDEILDLVDDPIGRSGGERIGGPIHSVDLLDGDELAFVVAPVDQCNPTRYPAMLRTVGGVPTAFRQPRVDPVTHQNGSDPLDTLSLTRSGTTPLNPARNSHQKWTEKRYRVATTDLDLELGRRPARWRSVYGSQVTLTAFVKFAGIGVQNCA